MIFQNNASDAIFVFKYSTINSRAIRYTIYQCYRTVLKKIKKLITTKEKLFTYSLFFIKSG